DSSNAMFAGLSLLTPHPTPQPVAKPVVLSTFCSTCSTVAHSSSSSPPLSSELSSSLHSGAPSDPHPLPPGLSSPLLPPSTPLPFSVHSTPTHSIAPSSLSLDDWVFGGDLLRLLHSESASLT
ncbi:MAG: hypothetical protein Q8P67_21500, partial [archaeon]|nr:hypothetical protein [archaeon]